MSQIQKMMNHITRGRFTICPSDTYHLQFFRGTVAAPVFKEITMKAMPYLGVEPLIVHRKAARTRNNDRGGAYQNF